MTTKADVKDILKDTVSIEAVGDALGIIANLNLKRQANRLQGNCIAGHESKGGNCFNLNLTGNYYHCWHCGISGDIFSLVMEVNKLDFPASIRWVCEQFKPYLLEALQGQKPALNKEQQEYYRNCSLLEALAVYGKELLYSSQEAKEALDYLTISRKFDLEVLKKTDWFYLPLANQAKDWLLSQYPEQEKAIKELRLVGSFGDNFRLAFPYKDRHGNITGFVKRATNPKGYDLTTFDGKEHKGVRYDSTPGTKKTDIFGLYQAKGQKDLIIVEGYPDCQYFQALGHKNVVALGQGAFSKNYIDGLLSFGVKSATLALDNDGVGNTNTQKAIAILQGQGLGVYVIPPETYGDDKDPDEVVRNHGLEAFQDCIDKAISANHWLAQYTVKTAKMDTDKGKQDCFDSLVKLANACSNPIERKEIKRITVATFEDKEMASYLDNIQAKEVKEERQKAYQKAI